MISKHKVKIGCRLKLLCKHGLLGFQRENYPNRCQLNYLPSWTRKANSRMSPCLKCDIYVSRLTSFPPLSLIIFIFIRIWIWSPRKPTSFMSVLTPPAVTKAPNIHYRGTNLEMWTQGCHLDLLLVRKYQAFSFPLTINLGGWEGGTCTNNWLKTKFSRSEQSEKNPKY